MNSRSRFSPAFTLVELMVSTAIIGLIMLVLVSMTDQTGKTWRSSTKKIEKFQSARDGFEAMTRRLAQATLNTNWDYLDKNGQPRDKNVGSANFKAFVPVYYGRTSDLRFVSAPVSANNRAPGLLFDYQRPGDAVFFQAPFGNVTASDAQTQGYGLMNNLLNTWGYFVEAGPDPNRPTFVQTAGVPQRWRSRLWEFMLPAEQMALYDKADTSYAWFSPWFAGPGSPNRPAHVLAENILTLIVLPKLSKSDEDFRAKNYGAALSYLSPWYIYDSAPTVPPGSTQPIVNPGVPTPGANQDPGMLNPKNQLPPILMVTMIAVDELSAERLAEKYAAPDQNTGSALMGIDTAAGRAGVSYANLFTNASQLEDDPAAATRGDLYEYEQILIHEKLTYRIFTSNVTVRGSKWSRVQSK